jgi:hypothetical protein
MSTLKVATIQDTSGNNSSTPEQVAQGRAKAWLNFDGRGTIAITDDFNFSSVTDLAVGRYTANFTNSMSNANYIVVGTSEYTSGNNPFQIVSIVDSTTTTIEFGNQRIDNIQTDGIVYLAVFGD